MSIRDSVIIRATDRPGSFWEKRSVTGGGHTTIWREGNVKFGTWRSTPSDVPGMYVVLFHYGTRYNMEPTRFGRYEFWQSDDFEAVSGKGTVRVRRRLQMQTDEGWITLEVNEDGSGHRIYIAEKRI